MTIQEICEVTVYSLCQYRGYMNILGVRNVNTGDM